VFAIEGAPLKALLQATCKAIDRLNKLGLNHGLKLKLRKTSVAYNQCSRQKEDLETVPQNVFSPAQEMCKVPVKKGASEPNKRPFARALSQ
jgi:hypothetical protein